MNKTYEHQCRNVNESLEVQNLHSHTYGFTRKRYTKTGTLVFERSHRYRTKEEAVEALTKSQTMDGYYKVQYVSYTLDRYKNRTVTKNKKSILQEEKEVILSFPIAQVRRLFSL